MHSGGQWEHRGEKDQKLHPFPKGESALLTGSCSSLHLEGTCLLPAWIPGGITNTHQRGSVPCSWPGDRQGWAVGSTALDPTREVT